MNITQHLTRTPSREEFLTDLAREYMRRTDTYDETVCTGAVGKFGKTPINGRELGQINRHAHGVLLELIARAKLLGFERDEVMQAMRTYEHGGEYRDALLKARVAP